ncbi:hypothetical protein HDF16_003817 [Granulicella aggregans]|uniref:Uncharacterized protein n=1 Tax=Granulicella aggregans TaxID=474949 RepID=A0A7W7ZFP8_9BACT|nr:hypothetical protein [Granulicella aggregans]MBB5059094.1 hypothetical protein [Granulicella aggregans]
MQITIDLSDRQYAELKRATARANEPAFTPADWAREAVESALASHRLPTVRVGRHGPRIQTPEVREHRLVLPVMERVCPS